MHEIDEIACKMNYGLIIDANNWMEKWDHIRSKKLTTDERKEIVAELIKKRENLLSKISLYNGNGSLDYKNALLV